MGIEPRHIKSGSLGSDRCSSPDSSAESSSPPLSPASSERSTLCLSPPPGLQLPDSPHRVTPPPGLECFGKLAQDVSCVPEVTVLGPDAKLVEWHVRQFRARLRQSLGKPLVSPSFDIGGFQDVRLLFFPKVAESKFAGEGVRGKTQKAKYLKMISNGPVYGELKMKVPSTGAGKVRFSIIAGALRAGPFECDFSQQTVQSVDGFDVDWLSLLHSDCDSMTIGLEMADASAC